MAAYSEAADGAWGLRFPSLRAAARVLVRAPDWPVVDVRTVHDDDIVDDGSSEWDSDGMRVFLPAGGHVAIVWPFAVTLNLPGRPTPECVVQPHLTTAAASISMRQGRQPFHAGAFELDGRAWGVLGAKEAGKSSTMALASRRGSLVVTDDLLVADEGVALAGPRCIDLRAEAAAALDMGDNLGVVGRRERWRVRTDPCPPALPIAGFIVPAWGEEKIEVLSPVARLQVLFSFSAMQGVTMNVPDQYLRLAALPMLAWVRPRSWSSAQRSFEMLLRQLGRSAEVRVG